MAEHLAHHHGDGVSLFAGGTAGHPHPQGRAIPRLLKFVTQPRRQPFEGGRITKEGSHRYQQVAHQGRRLLGILEQQFAIGIQIHRLADRHAPSQLALQG